MEVHVPPVKKYMAKYDRHEPMVQDHSAVIVAKTCFKKYFFKIVLGFQPKNKPAFFAFGTAYHKFREVLSKQYLADESPHRDLPETQLGYFDVALKSGIAYLDRQKYVDPPAGDRFEFLTRARYVESCATAFKHWQKERAQGRIEVIAVEQNFIVPLPDGTLVGGKADEIVRWNGKVWGRDFKTSSKEQNAYYTRTLDPNDQFTRYAWAEQQLCGEPVQGIIVEVLYNGKGTKAQPKKGPEIFSHLATRSQKQIERWVTEQVQFSRVLDLLRSNDVYPMEEQHCPFCEFHSVCKAATEQAQMAKLESEFRVDPWDCTARDVDLFD